jgi:hypothetical protein
VGTAAPDAVKFDLGCEHLERAICETRNTVRVVARAAASNLCGPALEPLKIATLSESLDNRVEQIGDSR